MRVRVRFVGIPGKSEVAVECSGEVEEILEKLGEIHPDVFPKPREFLDRFLVMVEDESGRVTNIRLKEGLRTRLEEGERLVIMPPLTGGGF